MLALNEVGKYSVSFYTYERKRIMTMNHVKKIAHVWNWLKRNQFPSGVLLVYQKKSSILLAKFKYNQNGTISEFN
jgi:hypothetical protein